VNQEVTHSSLAVVLRKGRVVGQYEALAMLYTRISQYKGPPSWTSIRLPMETQEPGESRWVTAANCMRQEVFSRPNSGDLFNFQVIDLVMENGEPKPAFVSRCAPDPGRAGKCHYKCVFLFEINPESEKDIRAFEKQEPDGVLLGPPSYIELAELLRRMSERSSGVSFHRAVILKVMDYYARKSRDAYNQYQGILEDPNSVELTRTRDGYVRFE
jgi:hypothetical protein